ncbi:hypothetical protein GLAREA_07392 [Glarea lozoyensis ATCC 20868]|uniref:Uncharacterized protein n=1 Tax=Glarea lozoyensis (strain ATCC 20868 / MF5171) TaxID=1116229 RepID=S3D5A0_GLAL2|nr:uncharacterized protein GLAREA_07392 [Glarea lozoyensis ATCC 20868]EPE32259.1 hypothetical protein GLAREA_07392 [Glarea lozoyensis ATCC 20868]
MPGLPVLVMLFPIISTAESLVLFISRQAQQQPQQSSPPWWALGALSASSILLYNEYRLMVPGIIWCITSLLTLGGVRALLIIDSRREFGVETRAQRTHGFIVMTLIFGLIFSSATAYLFEQPATLRVPYPTLGLVVFNVVSLVGTVFTGTSLMVYSPISLGDDRLESSNKVGAGAGYLTSFASSVLVLVAAFPSQPATVVSKIQIMIYLLASFCVLVGNEAYASVFRSTDLGQQVYRIFRNTSVSRTPRKVFSITIIGFIFAALGLALYVLESNSLTSTSSPAFPFLPSAYNSSSTFDIVVSAYLEDPELIKSMLDSLKETAYLRHMTPNVILYTKDPAANITALKDTTGADIVKLLDNVGREGGTYLHHIITNWDNLAEKTMFIQAHAHNMRELVPRINDYLVPETGMLSLGFAGITCSCLDCQDRWGWEDEENVIPALYQQIYNRSCDSNMRVLLSYKGQFVASAKRIRGISKAMYEELFLAVTTDEGWRRGRDSVGYTQLPENPDFGFTLERLWGLLMQCATDSRVAVRCPSLLSGKGLGGDVRDCQCLDA